MTETKQILWDAERLALFSNANAAKEVKRFHAAHDDYFPRSFWNYKIRVGGPGEFTVSSGPIPQEEVPMWRAFQRALQEAWQVGFPREECVRLISCGVVPERISGKSEFEPDLLSYPAWPYQMAVMFLGVESWRARFCGQCGKRFVADKPARRFCSNPCAGKARQASRSLSWSKHGEKWRDRYERKKAGRKRGRGTKR
jgi:hypothetical protein